MKIKFAYVTVSLPIRNPNSFETIKFRLGDCIPHCCAILIVVFIYFIVFFFFFVVVGGILVSGNTRLLGHSTSSSRIGLTESLVG